MHYYKSGGNNICNWNVSLCCFILIQPIFYWLKSRYVNIITLCCCSVAKSCVTLCDPMNCNMAVFHVLHYLPEFAQVHVHYVCVASNHLEPPSPLPLNLFQHQDLFQWVGSSHQVAKVLELQLYHQSFQRIFKVDYYNPKT